jgi:hypothetical protein
MLVILLVLAGVVFMFDKELAGHIVGRVVSVVILLSVLPFLVRSCACLTMGAEDPASSLISNAALAIGIFALLAMGGFVAWMRRANRAKAHEIWARRHGSPRVRSLPSAPAEPLPNTTFPKQ